MTVDEIKIRFTAFGVLLLTLAYIGSGAVVIPVVLVTDFALRSFNLGRWSPLFRLSSAVADLLGPVAVVLSGILAFFAALEPLAGFCAGCYVYDLLRRISNS
jgi:hypothetical protein